MKELLKLTRFWVAVAGVAAVVINHFFGLSESQTLAVLVTVISAALGTSAGLTAGQRQGNADAADSTNP
jgi:ABC-type dipeptide/oligopeptide/nickel transport system permease subunit